MSPFKFWRDHEPATFVTAYILSGLVAILIPVIKHTSAVRRYNQSYNNYNNYNNYENNNNNSGDRGWTDLNNCKWWKLRCKSLWVNENGVRTGTFMSQNLPTLVIIASYPLGFLALILGIS